MGQYEDGTSKKIQRVERERINWILKERGSIMNTEKDTMAKYQNRLLEERKTA